MKKYKNKIHEKMFRDMRKDCPWHTYSGFWMQAGKVHICEGTSFVQNYGRCAQEVCAPLYWSEKLSKAMRIID